MGRSFNGSSAYLEASSAAVTAEPLTMACWFNPANVTSSFAQMSIGTSGGSARWQMLSAGATAGDPIQATSGASGGGASAASKNGILASTWQHGAAVFPANNSRTAYLNGVAGTTDTVGITVSGVDRTIIGARYSTTIGLFFNGLVSDAAIWNVALNGSEIASLAYGTCPLFIRPESLVFYNPLNDRWTYDQARGLFLTDTGPTGAADDPSILYRPRRKFYTFGSSVSAAGFGQLLAYKRNRLIA